MSDGDQAPRVSAPRCAMCGAPLAGVVGGQARCAFCGSLNLVEDDQTRLWREGAQKLTDAALEARSMYEELQPRLRALEQQLTQSYVDRDLAVALHLHEAILRLVMAPQYHVLRAADQSQRWVQQAYAELERTLAQSLQKIRDEWRASGRAGQETT